MKPASEVTCLVVDSGQFIHVARRLVRDFARVFYWSPWETAFPRFRDDIIGDGYEEITRVECVEEVVDKVDCVVFSDIGFSGLQKQLRARGIPVWGCFDADELEAKRGKFLQMLEQDTDLPVPKAEKVKGLTNLRLYLKEHDDQFIKVSTYRGDFETFHWRSMAQDEQLLDELAVTLGPLKENLVFWVFQPIQTEIEDGVDAYCIDGQWPKTIIHGMEAKDSSYLGAFQKFIDLPPEVRIVNEAMGPVLGKYGYRSFFSTEVRITKEGESFFIDPTARAGSPPSQVVCEMMANYGEIVWGGANGVLVEPESAAQFGCQAIFKVDRDHWGVFELPPEIDQWVKISFSCKQDGKICVPPDPQGITEVGWCCGIGDTMEEAIEHLREVKDQMPDGVKVEFSTLADLLTEIQTAEESGMSFTDDKVPEPASVLED